MASQKQLPQQPASSPRRLVRLARRRGVLTGLAVLGAVILVAVLGLGYATTRTGKPTQAVRAAATTAPAGRPSGPTLSVPDFAVTAAPFVGGQRFVLSEHVEKPTLLFFMASWCVTCVAEARAIAQLQGEMGQQVNFVVLDIDPGDNETGLQHFWNAAHNPTNVWALDRGSQVTSAYHVTTLDTTIVIAGGKEVARTVGGRSADALKAMLAAAGGPQ